MCFSIQPQGASNHSLYLTQTVGVQAILRGKLRREPATHVHETALDLSTTPRTATPHTGLLGLP